jgi:NAD-dependent dihydropyrimidine dehydrogenase PreA subunit
VAPLAGHRLFLVRLLCYYYNFSVERVLSSSEANGRFARKNLMAYIIAEPCIGVKDAACVDACPVDCIHPKKDEETFESNDMIYIDPVECIDCGACVPVCPVSAIFALDDLPEKWADFAQKNATFFGR